MSGRREWGAWAALPMAQWTLTAPADHWAVPVHGVCSQGSQEAERAWEGPGICWNM